MEILKVTTVVETFGWSSKWRHFQNLAFWEELKKSLNPRKIRWANRKPINQDDILTPRETRQFQYQSEIIFSEGKIRAEKTSLLAQ